MKILIGIVVTMIVLCLWCCVVAGIAADIEIQEMTDKNKQVKGCELEKCEYLISPEPKKQSVQKEYGNCRFCPYGKHQPCIGYCISKLYREVKRKR